MAVFKSRIPLGSKSRFRKNRKTAKSKKLPKQKTAKSTKLRKLFSLGCTFILAIIVMTAVKVSVYVQELSIDLPSPEAPFGKKAAATEIYDRNGKMLYRIFGNDDRDLIKITEVPDLLKWTFLAAEDMQFYHHQGVDFRGIARCSVQIFSNNEVTCGASTITQQLIKKTVFSDRKDVERKIKEIILALKIEQIRSKTEILEMYLNTIPEGSNVYGVKRAAKFYFGKELKDLNLAEMVVLAAIPQNPSLLSPTRSVNPEIGEVELAIRLNYVLDQLEKNLDFINQDYHEQTGKQDVLLTSEMIAAARTTVLAYQSPKQEITAPHFVFYLLKLLQERGYNGGNPFTLEEIETQGLRIYSTLDLDDQRIADEQVKTGVDVYGKKYGARNAALVAMDPKNGEILAMAGSYDYFAKPYPENCRQGSTCEFDPQVNIADTLQSYGSSMKPLLYYQGVEQGLISANTIMADYPIKIGDYKPKNYEGGFIGLQTARKMLADSRNIPAIQLVNKLGVDSFRKLLQDFGYTTMDNPAGYGPSIAIGGGDIKLVEHAQAYQILANEGKLTQHEAVMKITDSEGRVLFEYQPKSKQVADPKAVYIINDILNGKKKGPGVSFDGRDISGKTGTSEGQKETLFITYTPEIVVAGWLGNNNNKSMRFGASGFSSARPWISDFVKRIGNKIPPTPFVKPEGIVVGKWGEPTIGGKSIPKFIDYKVIVFWPTPTPAAPAEPLELPTTTL